MSWPSLPGLTFAIEEFSGSNDWHTVEASIPSTPAPGKNTLWASPMLDTSMILRVRLD